MPDWEMRFGTEHARRSGRSWWSLRYTDGRIAHEWDADPGSPNGHVDWPRMPYQGRQSLRLYCPNGQMAQLGSTADSTGRLFQFKIAHASAGMGGPNIIGRETLAHVIGIVHGVDGQCTCYAWEPLPAPAPPVDCPPPPGPAPSMRHIFDRSVAVPDLEHEIAEWRAAQAAFDAFAQLPGVREWEVLYRAWEAAGGGRLIGPWDDSVYRIGYQNVGRLNADVLGLDDGEGR